jgi:hypothetical protein
MIIAVNTRAAGRLVSLPEVGYIEAPVTGPEEGHIERSTPARAAARRRRGLLVERRLTPGEETNHMNTSRGLTTEAKLLL